MKARPKLTYFIKIKCMVIKKIEERIIKKYCNEQYKMQNDREQLNIVFYYKYKNFLSSN